jgi:polyhydroxyalkanoate synthesis repressor PhaR
MNDQRLIKKYPNRRLYDTQESRYITLEDIRKLVVNGIDFRVVAKSNQADITHDILLQVVTAQESASSPVMSRDFLSYAIRSHGGPSHAMLCSYLEQSVRVFSAEAGENGLNDKPSLELLATLASRDYSQWRDVQAEIYRTLVRA